MHYFLPEDVVNMGSRGTCQVDVSRIDAGGKFLRDKTLALHASAMLHPVRSEASGCQGHSSGRTGRRRKRTAADLQVALHPVTAKEMDVRVPSLVLLWACRDSFQSKLIMVRRGNGTVWIVYDFSI